MAVSTEAQSGSTIQQTTIEHDPLSVIVLDKEKKAKKKYSKSKRDLQELEIGATKANLRLAKAVYRGLQVWEKARDASAEKKRNGALRDALKNGSKSMRKTLKIAAGAPSDLLDAVADLKPAKRLFKLI